MQNLKTNNSKRWLKWPLLYAHIIVFLFLISSSRNNKIKRERTVLKVTLEEQEKKLYKEQQRKAITILEKLSQNWKSYHNIGKAITILRRWSITISKSYVIPLIICLLIMVGTPLYKFAPFCRGVPILLATWNRPLRIKQWCRFCTFLVLFGINLH